MRIELETKYEVGQTVYLLAQGKVTKEEVWAIEVTGSGENGENDYQYILYDTEYRTVNEAQLFRTKKEAYEEKKRVDSLTENRYMKLLHNYAIKENE